MKASKLMKLVFLLVCIVMQQMGVVGQNTIINKYTVAYKDSNYTFEVGLNKDYYTIKLENSKRIDTVYLQITDNKALHNAISKALPKESKEVGGIDLIASSLYQMLQANERENELLSKLQKIEDDKGAIVGNVSLNKFETLAYLISKKQTDKRNFLKDSKTQKNIFYPLLETIKYKCDYARTPNSIIKKTYPINIKTVEIAFESGIIKDILVKANLKNSIRKDSLLTFSNLGFIPIRNAQDIDELSQKSKNYLTLAYSKDSILIVDLSDVIVYNRKIPFSSGTYIPKDTTIYIDKDKNSTVTLHKPSMSEHFDIRIYTDALGYNGKNPNGIIQSEAQIDFILNQGKNKYTLYRIWNKEDRFLWMKEYRHQYITFNKISPYFKLMKIVDLNNRLALNDNGSTQIDLLEVFKYAHLNLGTDLNIVTYKSDSKLITLNLAGGLFRTTIGSDSIEKKNANTMTAYINPNLNFQFFESNKIDFNLRIGAYRAWNIPSQDILTIGNKEVSLNTYKFNINNWFGEFQQCINLHPKGEKQNSLFIRASEYFGSQNNHFTFQIGYSTSLNNLLKF